MAAPRRAAGAAGCVVCRIGRFGRIGRPGPAAAGATPNGNYGVGVYGDTAAAPCWRQQHSSDCATSCVVQLDTPIRQPRHGLSGCQNRSQHENADTADRTKIVCLEYN
jgi:hypothetical protein